MSTSTAAIPGKEAEVSSEQDSRELCFKQGKPCIYQSDDDEHVIITEWPNGVSERQDTRTNQVTRFWPDGYRETFAVDSPRDRAYPHVPRRGAEGATSERQGTVCRS